MQVADYKLEAKPIVMKATVAPATLTTVVSEESWQFFAFAFAAFVTLAFGVLDSLSSRMTAAWSVGAKVFAFFVLGYLTLRFWPVKNFLRRVMLDIKTDRR